MPFNWLAHSPGNFSFLRGFRPNGRRRRLVLGRRRRRRMRRVSRPHLVAGDAHGHGRSRGGLLRRIAAGGLPHFPGVVVVGHAARRHGQIEDAARSARCRPAPGCACSAPAGAAASAPCARRSIGLVLLLGLAEARPVAACRRSIRLPSVMACR